MEEKQDIKSELARGEDESVVLNELTTGSGIIDNKREIAGKRITLKDVLREMAKDSEGLKCAVGYFYISGIAEIIDNLKDLKETKILMGSETDPPTKSALIKAFKNDLENLELPEYEHIISIFYKLVKEKKNLQVRVYFGEKKPQKLHGKAYLFFRNIKSRNAEDRYRYGIIGSSNLSPSGLTENTELNIILREKRDMKYLEKWFDRLWEIGSDDFEGLEVSERITKAIEESKFKDSIKNLFRYLPPKEFFKVLIKYLNADYLFEGYKKSKLLKFQYVDFIRILNNFNTKNYRGTFLTSSVGLGKSYVAAQVAKYFLDNGKKVLIIAPAGLVKSEDQWPRYLKDFNIFNQVCLLSMGELQKDPDKFKYGKYRGYGLIVVDEVHNFRNPDSYRTRNLKKIIDKNSNAKVLFLSATPINTNLDDLWKLIELFRRTGENKLFDKLTDDLKRITEILKNKEYDKLTSDEKERLLKVQEETEKELFVKSTRETIKTSSDYIEELKSFVGVDITKIPDPQVSEISYTLHTTYRDIVNGIVDFIGGLSAAHLRLLDPEHGERLTGIFKWLLYKRFESDISSYYLTLKRLSKKNKMILKAVKTRDLSKLEGDGEEDGININFDNQFKDKLKEIIAIIEKGKGKQYLEILKDLQKDIDKIEKEIEKLKLYLERKSGVLFKNDKKIEKLAEILQNNKEKKLLIFTEYRDTLRAIKEHLAPVLSEDAVKFVDSQVKNKKTIIENFNDKENKLRIIVSTDTLSEGYNISGADIVVNFDIPYNPVRIIQRIGRTTRLDNPKEITVLNFRPAEEIDVELNLVEKLKIRIKDIIRFVGVEYRIWFEVEEEILKERRKLDKRIYLEILDKIRTGMRGADFKMLESPVQYSRPTLIFLQKAIKKYRLDKESITNIRLPRGNSYTLLRGEKNIVAIFKEHSYNEEFLLNKEIEEVEDSSGIFERDFAEEIGELRRYRKIKEKEEFEMEYRTYSLDRDIDSITDYIETNDLESVHSGLSELRGVLLDARKMAGSETEKKIRQIRREIKREITRYEIEKWIEELKMSFRSDLIQTKIIDDEKEKKNESIFVIGFKEA